MSVIWILPCRSSRSTSRRTPRSSLAPRDLGQCGGAGSPQADPGAAPPTGGPAALGFGRKIYFYGSERASRSGHASRRRPAVFLGSASARLRLFPAAPTRWRHGGRFCSPSCLDRPFDRSPRSSSVTPAAPPGRCQAGAVEPAECRELHRRRPPRPARAPRGRQPLRPGCRGRPRDINVPCDLQSPSNAEARSARVRD